MANLESVVVNDSANMIATKPRRHRARRWLIGIASGILVATLFLTLTATGAAIRHVTPLEYGSAGDTIGLVETFGEPKIYVWRYEHGKSFRHIFTLRNTTRWPVTVSRLDLPGLLIDWDVRVSYSEACCTEDVTAPFERELVIPSGRERLFAMRGTWARCDAYPGGLSPARDGGDDLIYNSLTVRYRLGSVTRSMALTGHRYVIHVPAAPDCPAPKK